MKIEINDEIWFGFEDDGFRCKIKEHLCLAEEERKELRLLLKEMKITDILDFDCIILCKSKKENSNHIGIKT